MTMSLANGKKAKLLEQERTFLNTLTYRLFINDHVPADTDVVGAYTQCPLDVGYTPLASAGFGPAFLNADSQAEVIGAPWVTLFEGVAEPFTVYGYYATDPVDGALVYAERDPVPMDVFANYQVYVVVPKKRQDTM